MPAPEPPSRSPQNAPQGKFMDPDALGPDYRQRVTPLGQRFLSLKRLEPVSQSNLAVLTPTLNTAPLGLVQPWPQAGFGLGAEGLTSLESPLAESAFNPGLAGSSPPGIQPYRHPANPAESTPSAPTENGPFNQGGNPSLIQRHPSEFADHESEGSSSPPEPLHPPVQISQDVRLPSPMARSPQLQRKVQRSKTQILRSLQPQASQPQRSPQSPPLAQPTSTHSPLGSVPAAQTPSLQAQPEPSTPSGSTPPPSTPTASAPPIGAEPQGPSIQRSQYPEPAANLSPLPAPQASPPLQKPEQRSVQRQVASPRPQSPRPTPTSNSIASEPTMPNLQAQSETDPLPPSALSSAETESGHGQSPGSSLPLGSGTSAAVPEPIVQREMGRNAEGPQGSVSHREAAIAPRLQRESETDVEAQSPANPALPNPNPPPTTSSTPTTASIQTKAEPAPPSVQQPTIQAKASAESTPPEAVTPNVSTPVVRQRSAPLQQQVQRAKGRILRSLQNSETEQSGPSASPAPPPSASDSNAINIAPEHSSVESSAAASIQRQPQEPPSATPTKLQRSSDSVKQGIDRSAVPSVVSPPTSSADPAPSTSHSDQGTATSPQQPTVQRTAAVSLPAKGSTLSGSGESTSEVMSGRQVMDQNSFTNTPALQPHPISPRSTTPTQKPSATPESSVSPAPASLSRETQSVVSVPTDHPASAETIGSEAVQRSSKTGPSGPSPASSTVKPSSRNPAQGQTDNSAENTAATPIQRLAKTIQRWAQPLQQRSQKGQAVDESAAAARNSKPSETHLQCLPDSPAFEAAAPQVQPQSQDGTPLNPEHPRSADVPTAPTQTVSPKGLEPSAVLQRATEIGSSEGSDLIGIDAKSPTPQRDSSSTADIQQKSSPHPQISESPLGASVQRSNPTTPEGPTTIDLPTGSGTDPIQLHRQSAAESDGSAPSSNAAATNPVPPPIAEMSQTAAPSQPLEIQRHSQVPQPQPPTVQEPTASPAHLPAAESDGPAHLQRRTQPTKIEHGLGHLTGMSDGTASPPLSGQGQPQPSQQSSKPSFLPTPVTLQRRADNRSSQPPASTAPTTVESRAASQSPDSGAAENVAMAKEAVQRWSKTGPSGPSPIPISPATETARPPANAPATEVNQPAWEAVDSGVQGRSSAVVSPLQKQASPLSTDAVNPVEPLPTAPVQPSITAEMPRTAAQPSPLQRQSNGVAPLASHSGQSRVESPPPQMPVFNAPEAIQETSNPSQSRPIGTDNASPTPEAIGHPVQRWSKTGPSGPSPVPNREEGATPPLSPQTSPTVGPDIQPSPSLHSGASTLRPAIPQPQQEPDATVNGPEELQRSSTGGLQPPSSKAAQTASPNVSKPTSLPDRQAQAETGSHGEALSPPDAQAIAPPSAPAHPVSTPAASSAQRTPLEQQPQGSRLQRTKTTQPLAPKAGTQRSLLDAPSPATARSAPSKSTIPEKNIGVQTAAASTVAEPTVAQLLADDRVPQHPHQLTPTLGVIQPVTTMGVVQPLIEPDLDSDLDVEEEDTDEPSFGPQANAARASDHRVFQQRLKRRSQRQLDLHGAHYLPHGVTSNVRGPSSPKLMSHTTESTDAMQEVLATKAKLKRDFESRQGKSIAPLTAEELGEMAPKFIPAAELNVKPEEEEEEDIDSRSFELLAREIYQLLQQRLVVDRERYGGYYRDRIGP